MVRLFRTGDGYVAYRGRLEGDEQPKPKPTKVRNKGGRKCHQSDDKVREIRRDHAKGESQASLARRFGLSKPAISLMVRGLSYRHVV